MGGRRPGSGLMMAGAIISLVGIGIVLMRALSIPRHWLPLLVGLALFLIGVIRWTLSKDP